MSRFAVVLGAILLGGCNAYLAQAPAQPDANALGPIDPAAIVTAPIAELDCAPARSERAISCD